MNWIKLSIFIILFLLIYGWSFYNLGNTIVRVNADNIPVFSLLPLFTEGFIGPLRMLFIMIIDKNISGFFYLLFILLTNFWSPYAVILFLLLLWFNLY